MKIETTLGTVIVFGGVMFLLGAYYGHHRTKENYYVKALSEELEKKGE